MIRSFSCPSSRVGGVSGKADLMRSAGEGIGEDGVAVWVLARAGVEEDDMGLISEAADEGGMLLLKIGKTVGNVEEGLVSGGVSGGEGCCW